MRTRGKEKNGRAVEVVAKIAWVVWAERKSSDGNFYLEVLATWAASVIGNS